MSAGVNDDGEPGYVSLSVNGLEMQLPTFPGMPAEQLEEMLMLQFLEFGIPMELINWSNPEMMNLLDNENDGQLLFMPFIGPEGIEIDVHDIGLIMDVGGILDATELFPTPPSDPVFFDDLLNHPLGNASFTLNSDGHLTVSNIGSSGLDGVSIDLGEAHAFDMQWEPMEIPFGGGFVINSQGSVDGLPNQELGTLHVQSNDFGYDIIADYSIAGTTSMLLQFYQNGQLIEMIPGYDDAFIGQVPVAPRGCGKGIPWGGLYCYLLPFPPNTLIDIPGHGQIIMDEIRVLAENGNGSIDYLSAFSVEFFNIPDLIITNEAATFLYPCEAMTLDPASVPMANYPIVSVPNHSVMPLPSISPISEIHVLPPVMMDPTESFICGLDYQVLFNQFNEFEVQFDRDGPYFIQYTTIDGITESLVVEVDMLETGENANTCSTGTSKEIDCGNPDVAVVSTGASDYEDAFDPKGKLVGSMQAAIDSICAAYTANGNQKVSLAVVGHGSSGSITIGSTTINASNIATFANAIKDKVSSIVLFSCSTGEGDAGNTLVCQLEQITGADVTAFTGKVWADNKVPADKWYTAGEATSWEPSVDEDGDGAFSDANPNDASYDPDDANPCVPNPSSDACGGCTLLPDANTFCVRRKQCGSSNVNTLDWADVEGAVAYQFFGHVDNPGASPSLNRTLANSGFNIPGQVPNGLGVLIQLRAQCENGEWGPWTEMTAYTISNEACATCSVPEETIPTEDELDIVAWELDTDINDVAIYPNPASDFINLSIKNGVPVLYTIVDMNGQVWKTQDDWVGDTPVSINELPVGMYFFNLLYQDGRQVVEKFIKK